jgi:two-component system, LytTR family, sensor kinase
VTATTARSSPRPSALAIVAAAVGVCAILALRSSASQFVGSRLDASLTLDSVPIGLLWFAMYFGMWAALTPFIFALARRLPFSRGRWVGPLALHLPLSVVVSAGGPLLAAIFFGGVVLGRGWPHLSDLSRPMWTGLLLYRGVSDTLIYWCIFAAGSALAMYDDDRARRLQAADLERALVTAQVDALKMKLQPHFLFNTLNSVSFLALGNDTPAIVTMVERLGNLLRASMTADGRHEVTLREELDLLDQYLAIEEVRFRDRLRVTRRIEPGIEAARFPVLTLQPLVENSIKHGFSRRLDASRLDITIGRDGDMLWVRVEDDGPGLPDGWSLETHCGRGLRNVIARLDALYRGGWSLSLTNAPGGGAVTELRLPCTTPDQSSQPGQPATAP